ncbi:MAG: hypothetical protein COS85_21590 [Armatimonadetes bacterium CG07_land_8_20_14_0_80_59_28]|nr:MAG: hypothetical protein COS85_21590 [Armatimonadetes bacterium CG07_land_8_20_14_0_80_59_28]
MPSYATACLTADSTVSWPWAGKQRIGKSIGWKKAIVVMSIAIIPIAVSVHTVVSYVFAMTIKPMWHSTIFGPYFVVGAIYSGIAALLIAMVILRKVYHFEEYLKPEHFRRLGFLLLTMCCLWFYFTFSEFLTTFYGQSPEEMKVFYGKMSGDYRLLFWGMVFCMWTTFFTLTLPWLPLRTPAPLRAPARVLRPILAIAVVAAFVAISQRAGTMTTLAMDLRMPLPPFLERSMMAIMPIAFVWSLLPYLRNNPIVSSFVASIFVVIGMWLERFVIVVPTLVNPRLSWGVAAYHPSWVEWSLTAFDFAGMVLLFVLFSKVFPMLPIWEMREGELAERSRFETQRVIMDRASEVPA